LHAKRGLNRYCWSLQSDAFFSVLHDEWLAKKTVMDGEQLRPYTPLEIAEKSKELPPYLAARSYSLYLQKKREAGELPPPSKADAPSPTTPKRRYVRKGAVGRKRRAAPPQQAPVACAPATPDLGHTWAPATAAPEPQPGTSAAPLPLVLPPPLQPVDAEYTMGDEHRYASLLYFTVFD